MRILQKNAFGVLRAAAFVLAAPAATPASAMGGGPTNAGGFNSPGDFGAHFNRDVVSSPSGFAGDRAGRHGGQFRGGANPGGAYPGYGGYNCNPAFVQNPEMCR